MKDPYNYLIILEHQFWFIRWSRTIEMGAVFDDIIVSVFSYGSMTPEQIWKMFESLEFDDAVR
jgi:hypothetical protein